MRKVGSSPSTGDFRNVQRRQLVATYALRRGRRSDLGRGDTRLRRLVCEMICRECGKPLEVLLYETGQPAAVPGVWFCSDRCFHTWEKRVRTFARNPVKSAEWGGWLGE